VGLEKSADHGVRFLDWLFRRIGVLKGMEAFLESLFSFLKLSEHHLDLIGAGFLAAQDTHGLSIPPFLEPGIK